MEDTVTLSGRHIPHFHEKRVSRIEKWPGLLHLIPTVAWGNTLKRRDDGKYPGTCGNKAFLCCAPSYPKNTDAVLDANEKFVDVVNLAVQLQPPGNHPWYSHLLATPTLIDH
jgi:hypothetical protein